MRVSITVPSTDFTSSKKQYNYFNVFSGSRISYSYVIKNVGVNFDLSTICLWYLPNKGIINSTNGPQAFLSFHGFFGSIEWELVDINEAKEGKTSIGWRVW